MPAVLNPEIQCEPHISGGWQVRLSGGEIVMGPNGRGLTAEEAEEVREFIEHRVLKEPQPVAGE